MLRGCWNLSPRLPLSFWIDSFRNPCFRPEPLFEAVWILTHKVRKHYPVTTMSNSRHPRRSFPRWTRSSGARRFGSVEYFVDRADELIFKQAGCVQPKTHGAIHWQVPWLRKLVSAPAVIRCGDEWLRSSRTLVLEGILQEGTGQVLTYISIAAAKASAACFCGHHSWYWLHRRHLARRE